jgi:hypothetical protein
MVRRYASPSAPASFEPGDLLRPYNRRLSTRRAVRRLVRRATLRDPNIA